MTATRGLRAPSAGQPGASAAFSIFAAALLSFGLFVSVARADQRRDFMLDLQPSGTFLLIDYFGSGGQLSLEHRKSIYGLSNDVTIAGGIIPTYPLGEAFVRGELRVLILNLSVTLAYRDVWRDLRFERGTSSYCRECDRAARRAQDPWFGTTKSSDSYATAETELSALIPFNENLVMSASGALRYEGRADRSFDWFNTSVYDHGMLGRFETTLMLKDRHLGGIGPYLQMLVLPRDGKHETQLAAGLNAVTRLGLIRRNDLVFFTFLIRPGDPMYGQHSYYAPVRALLIYRMMLEL